MKILVTIKRVEDPGIKIKVRPDQQGIDSTGIKYVINPFDEIALEEALRVRDAVGGEVVVFSMGPKDAQAQLRAALAVGADRGIHVVADRSCDPHVAAAVIAKIAQDEKVELVLMGKQAIDDDMGTTGAFVAERLDWAQATVASKEESLESDAEKAKKPALAIASGQLRVVREIDGGIETLEIALPCVVTCELRLNIPRYASLPGIMKAKKKEIKELTLDAVAPGIISHVEVIKMIPPPERKAGVMVPDIQALVSKLKNEAKVL